MPESNSSGPQSLPDRAVQTSLEQAFALFTNASQQLEDAYHDLQLRVGALTEELAVANGELRRQYIEKEALSQRLSSLLQALPAGVVEVDGSGTVMSANRAASVLVGEDLVGRDWSQFTHERLQALPGKSDWRLLPTHEAEPEHWLNLESSQVEGGTGSIILMHDVTDAYHTHLQLEHHKRLSAMGEMAAALAHQLRTPLATALLYTSNLTRPGIKPEDVQRFADKSVQRLHHLEKLVQDMLRFVRGGNANEPAEPVSISQLLGELHQTIDPQIRDKQMRLQIQDDSQGAQCIIGRKTVLGALLNLCDNAIQLGQPGSLLSITVMCEGENLRIDVRDEGPGIPEQVISRIFEPFFTTRMEGTGLGLAIARNAIASYGGQIVVESRVGQGSVFTIRFPLAAARP